MKFSNFDLIVPYKSNVGDIDISDEIQNILNQLGFDFKLDNKVFKLTKIPDELKYAEVSEIGDAVINFIKDNNKEKYLSNLAKISYGRLNKDFGLGDKSELLCKLSNYLPNNECKFNSWCELNRQNIPL